MSKRNSKDLHPQKEQSVAHVFSKQTVRIGANLEGGKLVSKSCCGVCGEWYEGVQIEHFKKCRGMVR